MKSPWDAARKRVLVRYDRITQRNVVLERGVNFFVEALERLGAKPFASCEGHPTGFYVAFRGPASLAVRIADAGWFCVAIRPAWPPGGRPTWRIGLEWQFDRAGDPVERSERAKRACLRSAASTWRSDLL